MLDDTQSNIGQPTMISLDCGAQSLWKEFQSDIETQLRPDGRLSICQGWAGKICGFTLQIAALLHVASANCRNNVISKFTMQNAVELAKRLVEHSLAAFHLIGVEQSIEDAKIILQWIQSNHTTSFTKSDIALAMRNKKMRKTDRLQKALIVLSERNIISNPIKLPTRKPTTIYYVNPLLLNRNHAEGLQS